jgi:hypothetical protein
MAKRVGLARGNCLRRSIRSTRTRPHAIPDTCCYTFAVQADVKAASRKWALREAVLRERSDELNRGTDFLDRRVSYTLLVNASCQAALTRSMAAVTNACINGSIFAASFSSYA